MWKKWSMIWWAGFCVVLWHALAAEAVATPPLPVLPIPSSRQVTWQAAERALFFHFGMNTFTDSEWGTGKADPSLFYPQALDAHQWVSTAKEAGFSRIILTAKHHDGFCLWPSSFTNYSVALSPWRAGAGDLVAELSSAAHQAGLSFGLYLSPWDRHESCYGDTLQYNEFYLALLWELLTRYGPIAEVWLDGAKGKDAPEMVYLFDSWFSMIRQLQPNAIIFSDAGPDARWVGNEYGESGSTAWAMVNRSSITIGGDNDAIYSQEGDLNGVDWVPAECDVSIRPGWFWHSDEQPKSVNSLLELFYESVGRNCVLLLNVPPNTTGLISEEDAEALISFNEALHSIFSVNLAANATVTADSTRGVGYEATEILNDDLSTYWAPESGKRTGYLEIDLGSSLNFNVLRIQEAVSMGQRVISYHVVYLKDGEWIAMSQGTTIGYKKLDLIETVEAQILRLYIDEARTEPLIASFGIHLDSITVPQPRMKTQSSHVSRRQYWMRLPSQIWPVDHQRDFSSVL
ncbi:hypothetical protein GOP47_0009812 [Adiantum capillus-veneris]|uniref:alpha-L-fucosidase n=1 Tax=Adiantum capillus-veneris TaxID=13818 RepID=A0A9D4UXB2_ADICA|nr:hypothetical protein GOP47_0009812 [Adiantum capillus-veneris]